jgi:anaerobic selenocysteine-containing dehydrogenase
VESAVCYGRIGASTQAFGGLVHWLINVLNIITGNFDNPGGAMFTTPAVDVVGLTMLTGQTGNYNRWQSRVRGLPEFSGELPVSVMAEEILTEGEGQIKAMVTVAGNPVLSTPNGTQLERAFERLEFMVAVDIYINETTRHANIILPPATGLETDHYDVVFHYLAVRNTAKYSPALFEPEEGAKYDWEIFKELRRRLEAADESRKSRIPPKLDFFKRLPPTKIIDLALRFGPYGSWGGRRKSHDGINLHTLKTAPHGIDLGPLRPLFPDRLAGRRIQLAPEIIAQDVRRVRERLLSKDRTDDGFNLALIGRRHVRSNNSWMHNSKRLVRGKNRCTLMIHPDDAAARGIENGQVVEVRSRVGCVWIEAEITPDIMPGVVSIPHGWGHHRPGIQLEVAQQYAGVSINDLTDECAIDELTGNTAFSGIPVRVSLVRE